MNIAQVQEENAVEGEAIQYKVFQGVENFKVLAINPTMTELNTMGINATEEPVYHGKMDRNGVDTEYFSIRAYLGNDDASNTIKTTVNYTVFKEHKLSSTNKYKVINDFGSTTWLEDAAITDNTLIPSNMQWYLTNGLKKAYIGEEELIAFIKALRNLPNINGTADEDTQKKGIASFSDKDFLKLFKGDFSDIRHVIINQSKDCKVGFLLGARSTEEGIYRQGIFSRLPLKRYIKSAGKTEYLVKTVKDAQDNGAASTIVFDLKNTTLKEFDPEALQEEESHDDLPF